MSQYAGEVVRKSSSTIPAASWRHVLAGYPASWKLENMIVHLFYALETYSQEEMRAGQKRKRIYGVRRRCPKHPILQLPKCTTPASAAQTVVDGRVL
jgi:hypothetical protein